MYDFIDKNQLIYEFMNGNLGFNQPCSNLLNLSDLRLTKVTIYMGGIFIDLQNAFDKVNHDIL